MNRIAKIEALIKKLEERVAAEETESPEDMKFREKMAQFKLANAATELAKHRKKKVVAVLPEFVVTKNIKVEELIDALLAIMKKTG